MLITKMKYNHNAIKDDVIYCNFKDLTDMNNSFTASIKVNDLIPHLKATDKIKNNSTVFINEYDDMIQLDIDSWYYVIIYKTNKIAINNVLKMLTCFEYQNS